MIRDLLWPAFIAPYVIIALFFVPWSDLKRSFAVWEERAEQTAQEVSSEGQRLAGEWYDIAHEQYEGLRKNSQ